MGHGGSSQNSGEFPNYFIVLNISVLFGSLETALLKEFSTPSSLGDEKNVA